MSNSMTVGSGLIKLLCCKLELPFMKAQPGTRGLSLRHRMVPSLWNLIKELPTFSRLGFIRALDWRLLFLFHFTCLTGMSVTITLYLPHHHMLGGLGQTPVILVPQVHSGKEAVSKQLWLIDLHASTLPTPDPDLTLRWCPNRVTLR